MKLLLLLLCLFSVGCDTQDTSKPAPPVAPPSIAPPVKAHQFSVVQGTSGLIALRDDGKSCKTADLVCANKDGSLIMKGLGPGGASCSQLALTPLCSDLDKNDNDPLGIR